MVAFTLLRASLLLVGLLAPITLAAPTNQTVITPYGERPLSNVHAIPQGGQIHHVGDEVHIVGADGKVTQVLKNDGTPVRATPIGAVLPQKTGWVAYGYWYNTGSSPISSFSTVWTVPPVPRANHGQTVFLFNSIEPASGNAILQPVLQYGPSAAGGGAYWAVASWYLVGNRVYHTRPIRVSVGQALTGVIFLLSGSGTSWNYETYFSGIGGTGLIVFGSAQLVWATETLEAYGVTSQLDYPTGSTIFSSIYLRTRAGIPYVRWTAISDATDGHITTINTQGASNARITIKY